MTRLKRVVSMSAGGTPPVDDESLWDDDGLPWVSITDMTRHPRIRTTDRRVSLLGRESRRLPVGKPGTLLFAMYATVGATAVLDVEASWNQAILGLTPLPGRADITFVRYWLEHLRPDLGALTRSNTQDNLNAEQVGNFPFPRLDLEEQRATARYLDRETEQIDALISAKKRMIELAEIRWLTSARLQLVGANEPGERRELGMSWFPSVPASWIPKKIAWHKSTGSGTTPASDNADYYSDQDGTPWLTTSQLREGVITSARRFVTTSALVAYPALQVIPPGAILIAMYGATIGRVAILGMPATVNQACCALWGGRELEQEFLFWWLRAFRAEIVDMARGAGQPNISQEVIRSLRVPSPRLAEQRRIGANVRRERDEVDRLVGLLGSQIDLLRERRQALVTAAVSGGIDVSVAA